MVVFSEKPSLSDRKTYFIWDKPTLSNYCDNGLPYTPWLSVRLNVFRHVNSPGGGGGAHKHFFDRDARPRTNFN